jgi:hypothetical protein
MSIMMGNLKYMWRSILVRTLTRDTSDHVSCAISFKTEVPKSHIFRFENFSLEREQFNEVFKESWELPSHKRDAT